MSVAGGRVTRNPRVANVDKARRVGDVTRKERVAREALLPAPRQQVWAALTQADRLGDWLGGDVQIDPRPRGRVVVRGSGGVERQGRVVAVNQPFRLVIEWWEGSE